MGCLRREQGADYRSAEWTVLWSGVNKTKTPEELVVTNLSPVSTTGTEVDIVDDCGHPHQVGLNGRMHKAVAVQANTGAILSLYQRQLIQHFGEDNSPQLLSELESSHNCSCAPLADKSAGRDSWQDYCCTVVGEAPFVVFPI